MWWRCRERASRRSVSTWTVRESTTPRAPMTDPTSFSFMVKAATGRAAPEISQASASISTSMRPVRQILRASSVGVGRIAGWDAGRTAVAQAVHRPPTAGLIRVAAQRAGRPIDRIWRRPAGPPHLAQHGTRARLERTGRRGQPVCRWSATRSGSHVEGRCGPFVAGGRCHRDRGVSPDRGR